MQAAGIIAEYNPFHRGHLYQIAETRARLGGEIPIVCAMSGNFTQRGDFALLRKHVRAEAAICGGADLVLELPLPWALSSAEGFAKGGVGVLAATGIVSQLSFGSEGGDLDALLRVAKGLRDEGFPALLREKLSRGISFAAARQAAVEALLGEDAKLLSQPNNILGVEYCKALQGTGIEPLAIARLGAAHDGAACAGIASASFLRERLKAQNQDAAGESLCPAGSEGNAEERDVRSFLTPEMAQGYARERASGRAPVCMESCERAILARLRMMSAGELESFAGGREGLHHRFYAAAQSASSLAELLMTVKTKRYALARLRRLLLRAYLNVPEPPEKLPYLRVLAANARGRKCLAAMAETVPILTKPAAVRKLSQDAQTLFAIEARATDLYTLAYPDLKEAAGGSEWTIGPVMR